MHINFVYGYVIIVPEEGQNMRKTCNIFYIKLLCLTEICNLLPVNKLCG